MKNNNKLVDQSIKQLLVLMKELICQLLLLGINVFENQNLDKIADFTLENNRKFTFYL